LIDKEDEVLITVDVVITRCVILETISGLRWRCRNLSLLILRCVYKESLLDESLKRCYRVVPFKSNGVIGEVSVGLIRLYFGGNYRKSISIKSEANNA
jgi:hypothetical protein